MTVVGIDPGSARSAVVVTDGSNILFKMLEANHLVIERLRGMGSDKFPCAIETMRSWASPFEGKRSRTPVHIFETAWWSGRFTEAYGPTYVQQLSRMKVRHCILGKSVSKKQESSTDTLIRAALIQRFGGDDQTAKGTVKAPGPLHGFSNDLYAALAVALTYLEGK